MNRRLTDEELVRLEALERAATPGPWRTGSEDEGSDRCGGINGTEADGREENIVTADSGAYGPGMPDALLIVEGRNALPALLSEVIESRAAVTLRLETTDGPARFVRTDARDDAADELLAAPEELEEPHAAHASRMDLAAGRDRVERARLRARAAIARARAAGWGE